MITRARRALTFLSRDFIARVRGAMLPKDRDRELCEKACYEPSQCAGEKCWVAQMVEKSSRTRATLGPPGRRGLDPVGAYLMRNAKRRGA
jgi:hypothetical protein